MPSPQRSVTFWDQPYGTSAIVNVGDLLLPTVPPVGPGYLVATTANRGSLRSEGIAYTASSGTAASTIEIWQVGTIDASLIPDLGVGAASWVRASTLGRPERFTPVANGTSDVIGFVNVNGRLALLFNMFTENIIIGAGSSITLGGIVGDLMVKGSSSALTGLSPVNGNVAIGAAGVWTTTPAITVPTGTNHQLLSSNAAGGMQLEAAPGTAGNVLTSSGGVWASVAPSGSGAPVGASYVTMGLDATLTAERVLTASTGLSLADGGANGNATLSCTVTGYASVGAARMLYDNGSTTIQGDAANTWDHANAVQINTGALAIGGGTTHTSALVRAKYPAGLKIVYFGDLDSTTTNFPLLWSGPGDAAGVGGPAKDFTVSCLNGTFSCGSGFTLIATGSNSLVSDSSKVGLVKPLSGSSADSQPFRWFCAAVTTSGTGAGNFTLTAAQFQARILQMVSTDNSVVTGLIAPNTNGTEYLLDNLTSGVVYAIKKSGGTGISVANNHKALVYCDASGLTGAPASGDYVRISADL